MIEFRTQYNKRELDPPVPSCPGDPEVHKYSSRSDEFGHIEVYDAGVDYNMQDYIDSWKDTCDINLLVKRFKQGEEDALNRVRGFYGDFTNMPTNFVDFFNKMQEGKDFFYSLDPALREQFNQNPLEFFAQMDTEIFEKKLANYKETNKPIEQTVIKKSEIPEVEK